MQHLECQCNTAWFVAAATGYSADSDSNLKATLSAGNAATSDNNLRLLLVLFNIYSNTVTMQCTLQCMQLHAQQNAFLVHEFPAAHHLFALC